MSETEKEKKLTLNLKQVRQQLFTNKLWLRRILIGLAIPPTLFIILLGVSYAYTKAYDGKVYPGVYIGNHALGGLTAEQVKEVMENANNRYAKEGITLLVTDKAGKENKVVINPIVSEDSSNELWNVESDAAAHSALVVGREGSWLARLVKPFQLRMGPRHLPAPATMNKESVRAVLVTNLSAYEDTARNAQIRFASKISFVPTVEAEQMGSVFNYDTILTNVEATVTAVSFAPVKVELQPFTPTISKADIEAVTPKLEPIFAYGNLTLTYTDATTKIPRKWEITPRELANWIAVERDSDNKIVFVLDKDRTKEYLNDRVRPVVDSAAQEARFVMEEGKVQEFQGSKAGLALNEEKTFNDIQTAFRERNYSPTEVIKAINITVDIAEPTIKTADVNNLGITEVVGVGVSSFRGSPPNRIRNISNAVKRLNGILIKPGEQFSTNKNAGPYTPASGYLPELVIKGNEIKKEVGGGMCQIGTTLFRMEMNSGMPITERRNHSLVVNYYSDPVNGNPGTDATVYDPLIDFKFLNDTGNYLLLQTDVDYKKQELVFTLWGKPDGRSGSYTHPKVSRWIPIGAKQVIEVDTLKPGETQCQHAYRGAVASFTYTRFTSSSEKIEHIFDSYYRPLPEICMVGKAAPTECVEGETCVITPTTPTPAEPVDTIVPPATP
ncbi:MAG TPA: VanW family protein [Patescibacteria group bacterium]|nr:VanW family protein [Patescibacteria group bacterium]